MGIDDTLMENKKKSIPRADVAELCIQALQLPEYRNRCVHLKKSMVDE